MPEQQLYYVQEKSQYVCNCVLWWGKDRCGYITQIEEAGLYTADECAGMRPTDVPWRKEVVEAAICRHVRIEHLQEAALAVGKLGEFGLGKPARKEIVEPRGKRRYREFLRMKENNPDLTFGRYLKHYAQRFGRA